MKKRYGSTTFVVFILLFSVWFFNCLPSKLFDAPVSLVLIDKNGELLSAHVAKDEQWRFPATDSVNPRFEKAIVAFEDKRFYSHIGVDALAICRAIRLNVSKKRVVSGGSTLSMQVVRLSRNNPQRSLSEKLLELFRAIRLELSYSKKEILNHYASHAPFGGNVVGVDAASWKYFGKSQHKLSWSEVALLAVLPNAPSLIHPNKNRNLLEIKRNLLLDKLYKFEHIDSVTCYLSKLEPLPVKPLPIPNHTPHLMGCFLNQGKSDYLQTTIDVNVQLRLEKLLDKHVKYLKNKAIYNSSILVTDVTNGKIVSYLGNARDEENKHQNMVDMIQSKRSTGSVLKPLLYAESMDKGMIMPKSLVQDIPVNYHGYKPRNYDLSYDGVVPADQVVSRSLNVPSVNMLGDYGVHQFLSDLKSYGFTSIQKTSKHYGLSLILGGAEVTPWNLAKVYTGLVQKMNDQPQSMSVLKDDTTSVKVDYPSKASIWYTLQAMLNVTRPDEDKAWKAFSHTNKIAWKTGTSFGGRDAWSVGCTPEYVVVVWAGNANGEGRPDLSGVSCAAPIMFDVFNSLPKTNHWFPLENTCKVSGCKHSGMKAGKSCGVTEVQEVPQNCKSSRSCSFCKTYVLDSTKSHVVSGTDYPMLDRVEQNYFVLQPTERFYYQQKHAGYKQPPSNVTGSGTIKAIYPLDNASIYLPKLDHDKRSKMIAKIAASEPNDKLFWSLDNRFLSSTEEVHQLSINPSIGKHNLTVVNVTGERVSVDFEVLE